MLIAIAASTLLVRHFGEKGELAWILHHMDFTTAFLNGDLEEVIFMESPEGQGDSNHICQYCHSTICCVQQQQSSGR
jgi:hypothetical protein